MSDSSIESGPSRHPVAPGGTAQVMSFPAAPAGDSVSILDYWRVLQRYRWLILGIAAAMIALAVVAGLLIRPVYRAQVVFMPVEEDETSTPLASLASQLGSFATVAGLTVTGGSDKDRALAILNSRAFTEAFIRERNLMPLLFADDWDADAGAWKQPTIAFLGFGDAPTDWDAVELFDDEVRSVAEDPVTGAITMTIEWTDRQVAADWANDLLARVNRHLRDVAIDDARKSLDYLYREAAKTDAIPLQQAIYSLVQAKVNAIMLANVSEEYIFRVIDPAVAPDEDQYVWPNWALLILGSAVLGLMIGVSIAFFLNLARSSP